MKYCTRIFCVSWDGDVVDPVSYGYNDKDGMSRFILVSFSSTHGAFVFFKTWQLIYVFTSAI